MTTFCLNIKQNALVDFINDHLDKFSYHFGRDATNERWELVKVPYFNTIAKFDDRGNICSFDNEYLLQEHQNVVFYISDCIADYNNL